MENEIFLAIADSWVIQAGFLGLSSYYAETVSSGAYALWGRLLTFGIILLASSLQHNQWKAEKNRLGDGLELFIMYAHKDDRWHDEFERMLKPSLRKGDVAIWSDKQIAFSENWEEKIDEAMTKANMGLLLVSSNFLNSDFIMNEELPYLLHSRGNGKAKIAVVIVSDCMWEETVLKGIQAVHDPKKPLDSLARPIRTKKIKEICKKLLGI